MLLEKSFNESEVPQPRPPSTLFSGTITKEIEAQTNGNGAAETRGKADTTIKDTQIPPVISSLTCIFFNLQAVSSNPTKNKEGNPEGTHTPVTRELNLP
jgi:hypothetical protein